MTSVTSSGKFYSPSVLETFFISLYPPPFYLAGVLSLLSELEPQVKVFALNRLNQLVNDFWAEIAESVTHM